MSKLQLPDLLVRLYFMESNLSTLTRLKAPGVIRAKAEARVQQLRQEASDQGLLGLYAKHQDDLWLYAALCDMNTDLRFDCLHFAEHHEERAEDFLRSSSEGVPAPDPRICPFGTQSSLCGPGCPHWHRLTKADRAKLKWE